MSGLTVGWEYLTGYCVATDPASRRRAEWPPHPGRVFMALAAAWFETGEDVAEGKALEWLETLGDPQIVLPPCDQVSHRDVVTVFVPVNDVAGPSAALLQSAPSMTRGKQSRTFPCVWVGDTPCFLHWPDVRKADVDARRFALDRICGKVTRIGHSTSLVRMWVADELHSSRKPEFWLPDDGLAEFQARRVSEGTLSFLGRQFNRRGREKHEALAGEIVSLGARKKTIRGKGAAEQKAAIDRQVQSLRETLKSVEPRPPIRPNLGLWSGYRRRDPEISRSAQRTCFDSDLLILAQIEGPRLPSVSGLAVTQALRGAVMSHSEIQPPPPWVSGHADGCEPLRDGTEHLSYICLPFVGSDHADGHLLGAALIFPRDIPRPERGRVLGRLLLQATGESRTITLTLGSLGVWTLAKRDWSESREALQPETWTAAPDGATTWATVTPVVLDRFPKSDPAKERAEWHVEVAGMITTACLRIGLTAPVEINVGTTSWHRGSPRATVKRRQLRGHSGVGDGTSSLGEGFPNYPKKGSSGQRVQLHVYLRFAAPVVGPIVLCAGRFIGYGLCKPVRGGRSQ